MHNDNSMIPFFIGIRCYFYLLRRKQEGNERIPQRESLARNNAIQIEWRRPFDSFFYSLTSWLKYMHYSKLEF